MVAVGKTNRTFNPAPQTGAPPPPQTDLPPSPRVPKDLVGDPINVNGEPGQANQPPPVPADAGGYDTKTEEEKLSLLYRKWDSYAPVVACVGLMAVVTLLVFFLFRMVKRRAARGENTTPTGIPGDDKPTGGEKRRKGRNINPAVEDGKASEHHVPQSETVNPVTAVRVAFRFSGV